MSSLTDVPVTVLTEAQQRIQQDLLTALDAFAIPEPLKGAVYHAVMLGGKRVRPALCYATEALKPNTNMAAVRRAAVAIELIHCYSLAHDDLPCMDNDLLRRGQPTCHAAFGEDTALLAGDILQSMAFEVLGSRLFDQGAAVDATIVLKQMQILATASSKMVCGQVLDLQAEGKRVDQAALETIHRNKTGALISAAIMMAAVAIFEGTDRAIPQLREYGQVIGLAFQVQDDILDIISDTEVLGKTAGKDEQVEKSTYPALMGLEQAQAYATDLHDQALQALDYFAEDAAALRAISQFLWQRKS
ncbi:farnesyl diphosphate synthase [Acinetobacter indicus]|uniref:farnesyl diphosphate synthase n=1 Tax=Acinetobacter indicus TaxID=756892 RepID=UPI0025759354|nr:farnesyl diphosphate synthase [Acinetobacter indicus]MDM1244284.1 polyprenyl synthetase family protein [Acinetobacter indicus]MDM1288337.1 polyprenyl synthetase family protein [Acinetobacter indicus]